MVIAIDRQYSTKSGRKYAEFSRSGSAKMNRAGSGSGSGRMSRAGSGSVRGSRERRKGLEDVNKVDFGKIVQKEERSVGRVETRMYKASILHCIGFF